jgi:hypothetical protein
MDQPIKDELLAHIRTPPALCEYSSGPCDQSFAEARTSYGLFLYPSEPSIIAHIVEAALKETSLLSGDQNWTSWKHLDVPGQIIFCQICKALRFTKLVVADVSTLNFNVLFEIGYALGLGLNVIPIRDTTYLRDKRLFEELGLLDTLGYLDFQNSESLAQALIQRKESPAPSLLRPSVNTEQPLYIVKSPVQTDGMVRLLSTVKKAALKFRSFDLQETPRLSLHEAFKQVFSSYGVLVHLIADDRANAKTHNGRCAFIAGLAMASGRHVLMLQEADAARPIDYRDIIRSYSDSAKVPELLLPFIRGVVGMFQNSKMVRLSLPQKPLEKLDLGDLAAENEVRALNSYFVPTGQYYEVRRGHARLVVGRKGAGKSAIFYSIHNEFVHNRAHLVLDLKPDGHQFTKLKEAVLLELSPGLQQHVLTAFWNYLLLMEIAHKIVHEEYAASFQNPRSREAYLKVVEKYGSDRGTEQGDFSERLLRLVNDIVTRRKDILKIAGTAEVTELVYGQDIRPLSDALSEYLAAARKEDIWLLFDDLDKGWPVRAATQEDILLLKCLLEATRKLQKQFESRGINFHGVVFIRNDIYQLVLDPADRGKDTPVQLDWNDAELFKDILLKRIKQNASISGDFDFVWRTFVESHVGSEESFSYILNRTLMRPRDVLRLVRGCIDVAVNRGHEKVSQADIWHAEKIFSDDAFLDIRLELKDINPRYVDVPYAFIGSGATISRTDVEYLLLDANIEPEEHERVIELLLWFGFLGIYVSADMERYSYQFQYDLKKMQSGLRQFAYCIHPSFRASLGTKP